MELPRRKNIRAKDYGYRQNGAYFVTVCTQNRLNLFGEIIVGAALAPPENGTKVILTEHGRNVKTHIESLPKHYDEIFVDKYVIMPNHIHMIVVINTGGASAAPATTLGNLIRGFKAGASCECGFSLWQPRFHDHIIRDEVDYQNHWRYIDENPLEWAEDEYYCNNS